MNPKIETRVVKRRIYMWNTIVQRLRRLTIQEFPSDFEDHLRSFDFDELTCGMGLWYTVNSGMPAKERYGIIV